MNQRKIGEFLKQLRKEKGLTQEQAAEHFYVSSRTVSRWETGKNTPDLDMLVDIAEFYAVDIYEIIDGERKSERVENKAKLTAKKVVEYATKDRVVRHKVFSAIVIITMTIMFTCVFLFGEESKGLFYGIVSKNICSIIVGCSIVLHFIGMITYVLESMGIIDKINDWKKKRKK